MGRSWPPGQPVRTHDSLQSSFPLADSAMHIGNDLFAIVMGVAQINFHQRQVISIYCTNSTVPPLNLRWVEWLRNPKSKCK